MLFECVRRALTSARKAQLTKGDTMDGLEYPRPVTIGEVWASVRQSPGETTGTSSWSATETYFSGLRCLCRD